MIAYGLQYVGGKKSSDCADKSSGRAKLSVETCVIGPYMDSQLPASMANLALLTFLLTARPVPARPPIRILRHRGTKHDRFRPRVSCQ